MKTALRRCVPSCLPLLLLAGCATKMMPAPEIHRVRGFDVFAGVPGEARRTTLEILYATDRAPTGDDPEHARYGSDRGGPLRLGRATVHLGARGGSWERLVADAQAGRRPPISIGSVEEYGSLWTTIPIDDPDFEAAWTSTTADDAARDASRRFAEEIDEALDRSAWKEIVVYVPGFNTEFETPVRMIAQLGHFMARDGVFIAYSWPSRAHPFAYSKDRTNAAGSVRSLREFLRFLAEETRAETIHLLSYSAGAPLVSDALLQLRLMHAGEAPDEIRAALRIGNVVYAGSDEDLACFRNLFLDGVQDAVERITVYTSENDAGLALSTLFVTGSTRLGRPASGLSETDRTALRESSRVALINVDRAKLRAGSADFFGHGYWFGNAWVSSDLILLMRGYAPADRGLAWNEDGACWEFPRSYDDDLRRALTKGE